MIDPTRSDDGSKSIASVLALIEQKYQSMTPAHQTIAKYLVEHHRELAFASITRVSAAAGASPTTIVRFATDELGLSGYGELQDLAQRALREEVDTVRALERKSQMQDTQSLLALTLRADITNLERALTTVSEVSFTRAVEIISAARRVHLVGLRSTYGLVRHFEFYLDWIGKEANVLTPGIGDLPEQLLGVLPEDACVALSFRRYTRGTVDIFAAARHAGARTIAITDSPFSPLAEHAGLTLPIPVDFPTFFESRTAALSLINALVLGVSLARRRDTLIALKRHETAWASQKTYANEDFQHRFNAEVVAFETRAHDEIGLRPRRGARSERTQEKAGARKQRNRSSRN
jgi:DNA-binding MurR/RpiR family transcriptional regulator